MMIDPQPAHPWIADWLKPLIGVVVGFLLSFVTGFITDWKRHRRMRRALYAELLNVYSGLHLLLKGYEDVQGFDDETILLEMNAIRLDAYEHAKRNPDVFYELKECWILDRAFDNVHSIKANMNKLTANISLIRSLLEGTCTFIQDAVNDKQLERRLMVSISRHALAEIETDFRENKAKARLEAAATPENNS